MGNRTEQLSANPSPALHHNHNNNLSCTHFIIPYCLPPSPLCPLHVISKVPALVRGLIKTHHPPSIAKTIRRSRGLSRAKICAWLKHRRRCCSSYPMVIFLVHCPSSAAAVVRNNGCCWSQWYLWPCMPLDRRLWVSLGSCLLDNFSWTLWEWVDMCQWNRNGQDNDNGKEPRIWRRIGAEGATTITKQTATIR